MNTTSRGRGRSKTAAYLLSGASVAALALGVAAPAFAQNQASEVEAVVVTGTSIRGVAPVGSSVVSVGQEAIQKTAAQTVQQVLKTVPAVVGLGSAGQGAFGSADGAGTNAPTIHGLGASASNSTLILIDGHRLPLSGINHALADPNILPPLALQRVEVLADGASSVYGSDAVAGVVNFITRRRFNGVEASAQAGFGDQYHTYTAGGVAGKTWDSGSVLFAYGYSDRSNLSAGDRAFTKADHRAQGGSNLATFNCSPAVVQPSGSTLLFASPYTGAGVANAAANASCDFSGRADLLPKERRHSLLFKVEQQLTDKVTISSDLVYSRRKNVTQNTRGAITATVFGPGAANAAQVNPFFVNPTGFTGTSQTIRFQADDLLGAGAHTDAGEETYYGSANLEYRVNDKWRATLGALFGASNSSSQAFGALCSSCANLALNGTTNGGGSLTAVSIPGTTTIVTQALNANNALDVWNSGSANRTSAAVRTALTDSTLTQLARQTIKDATLKFDGELAQLPAGPLKVAFGGELIGYTMVQDITRPNNTGPATTGSSFTHLEYERNVSSGFVEFVAPVVSPDQNLPFARRIDLNLSGRYDHYSDFGSTTNPKIGVNWELLEGFKLRANYARSFVAPALTSRGNALGVTGESGFGNYGLGVVNVPLAAYPTLASVPGCTAGAVTCQIGSTITGLQITGGNKDLKPQTGISWAVGADYAPSYLPGFRLSATYWTNILKGAITAPQPSFAVNAAGLNALLTVFPTGASAAQIAALTAGLPQNSPLPPNVYYAYSFQQRNALNLWVQGVDLSAEYKFKTGFGEFNIGAIGSIKTKFDQMVGFGSPKFSVLNTTGFNTTFPSVKFEGRANLGWSNGGWGADLFWNHTGSYYNWSGTTVTPITRSATGLPTGGGDKVKSNDTFDAHLGYDFGGDGLTKGLQVYVDATNIFDKAPSFYNNAAGYDTFTSNPIGRVISVGARKRW